MIIAICLLILAVLGTFSVILGGTWTGTISELPTIDETQIVNGTSQNFVIEGQEWVFNLDPFEGAIVWFVVIASLAALIGIRVLASGLAETSIRVAVIIIIYTSVWTLLSLAAYDLIVAIEVFGGLIYLSLTIAYAIGVMQLISGGNNNNG